MKNNHITLISHACKLLGWQGGTIHQVLSEAKNMTPIKRKNFIAAMRDFAAKSNEKDIFYDFLRVYYKPLFDEIKSKPCQTK